MKFARLLRETAEDLPELQCLFQDYKQLKKELKKLPSKDKEPGTEGGESEEQRAQQAREDEAKFVQTLSERIQLLNDRFLEREETCIIQLERLEAQSKEATSPEQRAAVYKRFVDFHGEVLLLVHWSVLAYTATVKILKKHHKRTGLLVRAPHLANLLSQPFCSTEMMTSLARKAEGCIHKLAAELSCSATSEEGSVGPAAGTSGVSCSAPERGPHVAGQESVASVQRVLGMLGSTAGNVSAGLGEAPESLQQLAQHVANMTDSDSDSEAHTTDAATTTTAGSGGADDASGRISRSRGSQQPQHSLTDTTTGSQPARPPASSLQHDMLHKTRVALTMWEELKKNASTPSTVLDLQRPAKRPRAEEDTVGSVGSEGSDCD